MFKYIGDRRLADPLRWPSPANKSTQPRLLTRVGREYAGSMTQGTNPVDNSFRDLNVRRTVVEPVGDKVLCVFQLQGIPQRAPTPVHKIRSNSYQSVVL